MRRRREALAWAATSLLLLVAATTTATATAMHVNIERLAARMRIDAKWDEIEGGSLLSRRSRQVQPKEISIQVTAPLFSSRLFEYGKQAQDAELPQALDVGKKVDLAYPVNFYGAEYKSLYILSNGAIGFEPNSRSYRTGVLPGSSRLIAPFWNRNDLRTGGHVYYREVTRGRVVERGQSEIRYQYDRQVKVNSALIVTWDRMQPLNNAALPDENTNTFQAAIFSTDNGTFANFIYSNIGWTQGAEAGFNAGDATSHFKLPTSGTPNIMYLEEYGNTGIPGEWMFELSGERVVSCKAGIKGDTCDQECSAGEWGPDCVHCCHCSTSKCDAASGACSKACAPCWTGPACQTRQEKCATRPQCAPNALSFTEQDRCGEPQQRCQCLSGFEGDGYKSCVDIDECSRNSTVCHERATCTNTPGRFFCQCDDGFSGDGTSECVASFFLPYDTHKQLPRRKNSRIDWQLKSPIKMFGETMDKLTITSSGLIATNDVGKEDGLRLEQMRVVGVAPLFANVDLSRGGSIAIQEVEDKEILKRVARTIADNYDEPFEPKSALVVTYNNVSDGDATRGNTLQAVLVGGTNGKHEKMTFVELLYKELASGGEAGILAADAASTIQMPAIGQLDKLSNVRRPGIWLYRIDRPQVLPCAQTSQIPPFCEKSADANRQSIDKASLPAKIPDERKGDLTLAGPTGFSIEQPSGTIKPTLIRSQHVESSVSQNPTVVSVTSKPAPASKTTKHPRPRPDFASTPHRPIVSLANEDFDVGPDVFDVTFPPYITVVPQLFGNGGKADAKGPRVLPDFTIKTKEDVGDVLTTMVHDTTVLEPKTSSSPNSGAFAKSTTPSVGSFNGDVEVLDMDKVDLVAPTRAATSSRSRRPSTSSATTPSPSRTTVGLTIEEHLAGVTGQGIVDERLRQIVQQNLPPTSIDDDDVDAESDAVGSTTTHDSSPIFVFTTTPKPTTRPRQNSLPRKQPPIVTGAPPKAPAVAPGATEEQNDRRLAIILPFSIILAWALILVFIAAFVFCKKRKRNSQLRSMYGAVYGIRPSSYDAGGKRKDTTYEDQLERAARLSGQPALQAGKISLYGSYWNLQQHHSPGRHSQERHSPHYSNNGYTNPTTRYNYAGHY